MVSDKLIQNLVFNISEKEKLSVDQKIDQFVYSVKNQNKTKLVLKVFNEDRKSPHFIDEKIVKIRVQQLKDVVQGNKQIIVKIKKIDYLLFKNKYYIYYLMNKLEELPYYEAKSLVQTIELLFHDYSEIMPGEEDYVEDMLSCLSPKTKLFSRNILNSEYEYWDLHPYNVMKDARGSYKLIDLEGFIFNNISKIPTYYNL